MSQQCDEQLRAQRINNSGRKVRCIVIFFRDHCVTLDKCNAKEPVVGSNRYNKKQHQNTKSYHHSQFANTRDFHLREEIIWRKREAKQLAKLMRVQRSKRFDFGLGEDIVEERMKQLQPQWGFDINLNHNLAGATDFVDQICAKLQIFSSSIDWKTIVTSVILCVSNIWYNWDRPATVFMSIGQFLMTLKLSSELIDQLTGILKNYYEQAMELITKFHEYLKTTRIVRAVRNEKFLHIEEPLINLEAQSGLEGFDFKPIFQIASGAFSTVLIVVLMGKLPGGDKFDTTFNRFSKLSGVIRSHEEITKLGNATFESIWDTVSEKVFGCERTKMDEWKNINAWISEVNSLIKPDFENDLKNNEQLKNLIETLLTRGLNIVKLLDTLRVPLTERQSVTQCVMFLTRARELAGSCGAGQTKPRVAPAIIHFFGTSGVGKSTTLWALIAELQAALGVTRASDLHEKTYFRRPGGKHWDGYNNGVNVTVCDDFGAMKDSIQKPNEEFLEAIHMSNTAFWQLNMAELADKRSTFFNSKVVLWTSNRSRFDVQSLTNPEAVINRVALKIRQRPHPNYAKTVTLNGETVEILDKVKVSRAIEQYGETAIFGCLLFDVIDRNSPNDEALEKDLNFEEIAARCVRLMKENMAYFENFQTNMDRYIESAIARCSDGVWKPPARKFDPNVPLEPQFGLKDVKRWCGLNYEHTSIFGGIAQPTYPGVNPTSEDLERLSGLFSNTCFYVPDDLVEKFQNCWASVDQYCFENQVDDRETAMNVFVNTEKMMQCQFDLRYNRVCMRCPKKDLLSRISERISVSSQAINQYVEKRFDISPSKFYMIVGGATLIFGLVSTYIYRKISKRITKVQQEAYDTDRTKAAKLIRIAESYDTDRTPAQKTVRLAESYSADKVSGNTRSTVREYIRKKADQGPRVETMDASKPTIKTEGWFFSSPCSKHGIKSGYCEECDNACAGGHGNLKGFCYVCDPSWYVKLGISEQSRLQAQAVVDQNAAEVVTAMYKNMYKLECNVNGIWEHVVNLIIVKGRLAILNRHVLHRFSDFASWRIRNACFPDGIEFNPLDCQLSIAPDDDSTPYGYRDVFMLELPRMIHQHSDITTKFMESYDYSRFKTLPQVSLIGYVPDPKVMIRQYFGSDLAVDDSEFAIGFDENAVHVRTLFKYNIQTVLGDCGAVLVAFDKNFHNKIFGIHCAGLKDPRYQGFGTPVSREFLSFLELNLWPKNIDSVMSPQIPVHSESINLNVNTCINGRHLWTCELPVEGNFYPIGKTELPLFQGTQTKIVPSPVHGMIQEPTMAPAILKRTVINGQLVDPMRNARMKASPISPKIDMDRLDECAYHFRQMIGKANGDARVLSYVEAITGIVGDECYPPMKRQTSPGYGWDKRGIGKTAWLGSDDYVVDNPELLAAYKILLDKCRAGQRPTSVWCDTLKDERRSLDKVAKAKTRLFSCGEMAYTLLFRQYFAGFIAHMTRNRIAVESCVGTNVYSMDWTKIARGLRQVGTKVLAGDFTNYDGTLHADILWKVLDEINIWYGGSGEETLIRTALWSEIVNSVHYVDNVIYMWGHSQPSGCPMTTILNCSYHSISARYVFLTCAHKFQPDMASLDNFVQYVRHYNYGDDDLWCISDTIVSWFNQVTITEAYLALGMIYTDEAKSGDVVPYRSLEEVNFLKRQFRWDADQCRYRAPLALATILEMAMWNHGTVDQYPITATILQDAVRELAQHDEQTFQQHLPKFEHAAEVVRAKTPVYFKTYKQYQIEEAVKLL